METRCTLQGCATASYTLHAYMYIRFGLWLSANVGPIFLVTDIVFLYVAKEMEMQVVGQ